jgi:hypothetical protein
MLAALLPLSLAACGSGTETQSAAVTNAAADGNYLARMAQLNEKERNAVLFRAISDAGRACQGVTRSAAAPAVRGNPAWVATCEDGTPWVVSLDDKGVASVSAVARTPGAG